jgi:hypothetical protein
VTDAASEAVRHVVGAYERRRRTEG